MTSLFLAAFAGHFDVAAFLISAQADIRSQRIVSCIEKNLSPLFSFGSIYQQIQTHISSLQRLRHV